MDLHKTFSWGWELILPTVLALPWGHDPHCFTCGSNLKIMNSFAYMYPIFRGQRYLFPPLLPCPLGELPGEKRGAVPPQSEKCLDYTTVLFSLVFQFQCTLFFKPLSADFCPLRNTPPHSDPEHRAVAQEGVIASGRAFYYRNLSFYLFLITYFTGGDVNAACCASMHAGSINHCRQLSQWYQLDARGSPFLYLTGLPAFTANPLPSCVNLIWVHSLYRMSLHFSARTSSSSASPIPIIIKINEKLPNNSDFK